MNRAEYKKWWRETRIEARKAAEEGFFKYPDALTVRVPYFRPFYATTKENMKRKAEKQIANSLASINGLLEPYPEERGMGFIEVRRQ